MALCLFSSIVDFSFSSTFLQNLVMDGINFSCNDSTLSFVCNVRSSVNFLESQVLNEFTHGKQEKVSKSEFKGVLSDILLGMAAGLKRDPIVILRIDGEDLLEFINGPSFEPEIVSIYSQIEQPEGGSLRDTIVRALDKLSVEQGMPPSSDSWVRQWKDYHPLKESKFSWNVPETFILY